MIHKIFPLNQFPTKNQEMSITLKNGKTFTICSKGQYAHIISTAKERIIAILKEENEPITQEIIDKKISEWAKNECTYAPLDIVFSQMTPEEVSEWKKTYRFQGLWRSKKS